MPASLNFLVTAFHVLVFAEARHFASFSVAACLSACCSGVSGARPPPPPRRAPGCSGAAPGGAPGAAPEQPGARRGGGGGRAPLTPEQQAERQAATEQLAKWRASANANTWKAVTKKFNDAGIDVALLCYNMQDSMKDEDIEYGFSMAEGLGVKGMTTSTTLTMAKRIAPVADKHKLLVGYHGHAAIDDPNQTATLAVSYTHLRAHETDSYLV